MAVDGRDEGSVRAHSDASALLSVARRIDADASVTSVSKTANGVLVKLSPSSTAGTAVGLTILAALKLKFPFTAAALSENAVSGDSEISVLFVHQRAEFALAREQVRATPAMRLVNALANACVLLGLCSYGCLLYASTISSAH